MLTVFAIRFTLKGDQTLHAAHLNLLIRVAPALGEATHYAAVRGKGPLRRRVLTLSQVRLHHRRRTFLLRLAQCLHCSHFCPLDLFCFLANAALLV